jgi:hypothetical protein
MLTREEVIWGFRFCLGRDPTDDATIEKFLQMPDYHALRESLMSQPEFVSRMTKRLRQAPAQPFVQFERPAVVFIHVQKTAGTSLTKLLLESFPQGRRCPERFNRLDSYSTAELAQFDAYSGHFDLFSTYLIPRRNVFRFTMLRKPAERLISFYRFARAHPPRPALLADPLFGLARTSSAEEYFEQDVIRKSRWINNHYRVVFSGSLCPAQSLPANQEWQARPLEGTLANAVENMRSLDGIGITDHFDDSVAMIFGALKLPVPQRQQQRLMSTDKMPVPVAAVDMTPRLESALHDLIEEDDIIFAAACEEFDRRLAAVSK